MADEAAKQQKIGNFTVLDKIGKGGMGSVYKAEDPSLHRTVALKLLPAHLAADTEFVKRFQNEATAAARLSHSHLVQVYAAGEDNGSHYIAMEFVDGESLRQRLNRHKRLPPVEALAIATYVAEALRYAWNKAKIIHRDIKPDNILLSKDGEVKVADLGLAKSLQKASVTLTTTGMVMGSPFYISPEQAQGKKDLDFHTDIYSLGCTLFHMLAGQPPFTGDEMNVLFYKHIHEPPPDLLKLCPDCPPKVAQLVKRMMHKDPKQRPPTYDALLVELQTLYRTLKNAPAQKVAAAATQQRRTMVWIYGGAAAVLVLIAGIFVWNGMKVGHAVPSAPSSGSNLVTQSARAATTAQPPATASITPPREVTRPTTAVDDAFIKEVAALPAEEQVKRVVRRLKELNSNFDGTETHRVENGGVIELQLSADSLLDISPVRALKQLRKFYCSGNPTAKNALFSDLTPLCGLSLTELVINKTSVANLEALRGMNLKSFSLWYTPVRDLSPLQDMRLVSLGLSYTQIRDLSPLRGMPLDVLSIIHTEVSLSSLNSFPLRTLWCSPSVNNIKDLRAIKTLKAINNLPVAEFWKQVDAGTIPVATTSANASAPPAANDDASSKKPPRAAPTATRQVTPTALEPGAIKLWDAPDKIPSAPGVRWENSALVLGAGTNRGTVYFEQPISRDVIFRAEIRMNPDAKPQMCIRCPPGQAGRTAFGYAINVDMYKRWINLCTVQSNNYVNLVNRSLPRAYGPDEWIQLELRAIGDEIAVSVDGKLLGTVQDHSRPNAGGVKFLATSDCFFRNIVYVPLDKAGDSVTSSAAPSSVEDAFAKQLAALPASQQLALVLARLKELNPKFDAAKSSFKIEGGAVAELALSTVGVTNIAPVRALPALKRLTLAPWTAKERGDLTSLAPLAGMQLTQLWCHNNPIRDLKPLRDMPLVNLSIAGTRVTELDALSGSKLSILSCGDTEISDLGPLEGVPLTILWIQNTKVSSLAPLMTMPLQELRCDFDPKRDAKYLRSIRTLTKINNSPAAAFWTFHHLSMPTFGPATAAKTTAAKNAVSTPIISAQEQVRRFTEKMKELNPDWDGQVEHEAKGTKVLTLKFSSAGITTIAPVSEFKHLKELDCSSPRGERSKLADLAPLAGLQLTKLICQYNSISDLRPLKGMPLTSLSIGNNKEITDITPLHGMPLDDIVLDGIKVTDLSPLSGCPLKNLSLSFASVEDLSPLQGMQLERLYLSHVKGLRSLEPLAGLPLNLLTLRETIIDLAPLKKIPLKDLQCEFDPAQDTQTLRAIKTLERINGVSATEFWRRVKAGDIPKAKGL